MQKQKNKKYIVVASSSEVYSNSNKNSDRYPERLIVPNIMNPRYSYGLGKIYSGVLFISLFKKK